MLPSLDELIQNHQRAAHEQNRLIDRLEAACIDIIELESGADLPEIPPKCDVRSTELSVNLHAENAALRRMLEQIEKPLSTNIVVALAPPL
jgi:hypothetical protein